jgi:hypothetical protein
MELGEDRFQDLGEAEALGQRIQDEGWSYDGDRGDRRDSFLDGLSRNWRLESPRRDQLAGDRINLTNADLFAAGLLFFLVPQRHRLVDVRGPGLLVQMVDAAGHGMPPLASYNCS